MDIKTQVGKITEIDVDAIMVYVFADRTDDSATKQMDDELGGTFTRLMEIGDLSGKANETHVLYPTENINAKRIIVVGLGNVDDFNLEVLRQAVGTGMKKAKSLGAKTVATVTAGTSISKLAYDVSAEMIVEASIMSLYVFDGVKSSKKDDKGIDSITIMVANANEEADVETGIKRGQAYGEGTNLARELMNMPANICTPAYLADQATQMSERVGLGIQVLEKRQIQALKMGAFLAVNQGSDTPPRFIIMEHNGDKKEELQTIVLVGKGVTFDTGGYTLKSREGMIGMKYDMGGAAAVIGAMSIVASLDLPLHVVGLVPASDNMISGGAYRPQDVITASNGKTIEIISTDAEGRMLLADSLVYAKRYDPDAVVDIATLTGAAVVALGNTAAAIFSNDDKIAKKLSDAGDTRHERVWRMPLYAEYHKHIESDTADMKNSGGRLASAATAATFLSNFVDFNWGHVDMAGMMRGDSSKATGVSGGSGYGARLLAEFVKQWSE